MDHHAVILVVEDDLPTQTLLAALVRRRDCHAVVAADGREALRHLGTHNFDAIVLDLLLPEVNGFELLRHIKCTAPALLPRTVVVTAASPATFGACEELRLVKRLVRKPFDVADIDEALHGCIAV